MATDEQLRELGRRMELANAYTPWAFLSEAEKVEAGTIRTYAQDIGVGFVYAVVGNDWSILSADDGLPGYLPGYDVLLTRQEYLDGPRG